jgi:hypothetical protein
MVCDEGAVSLHQNPHSYVVNMCFVYYEYKRNTGSKPDLGMWDFVMDKSGAGAGFLRELRFPLQIFIPPNTPSSPSPGAGTIGLPVADVPSEPSMNSTPHYAN